MAAANSDKCNLYQCVIENMNTALMLVDQELLLEYLNPAAEILFDLSIRRVRKAPVPELFANSQDFVAALQRARSEDLSFTERELHLRSPANQRTIVVDCTISSTTAPGGGAAFLIEMQQKDHVLKISREEQLLAQQTAMRALMRGLAHEVKNPLGGLRGAAQLLERELPDPNLKEYTGVIIGEADRLQKLVDDMLGPNRPPKKDLINLHEILEHVRTLVLAEAPEELIIARDYDPSIPESYMDRNQLIQAVLNIVRNAYQAVGKGGQIILRTRAQRHIMIGQRMHKLVACVEIIDNGPGIAPEMLEHIFYPMVTSRPEGTGLGLSIAQSIVSQHGGLIQCASTPGKTQFTLMLPLDDGSESTRNMGETYGW